MAGSVRLDRDRDILEPILGELTRNVGGVFKGFEIDARALRQRLLDTISSENDRRCLKSEIRVEIQNELAGFVNSKQVSLQYMVDSAADQARQCMSEFFLNPLRRRERVLKNAEICNPTTFIGSLLVGSAGLLLAAVLHDASIASGEDFDSFVRSFALPICWGAGLALAAVTWITWVCFKQSNITVHQPLSGKDDRSMLRVGLDAYSPENSIREPQIRTAWSVGASVASGSAAPIVASGVAWLIFEGVKASWAVIDDAIGEDADELRRDMSTAVNHAIDQLLLSKDRALNASQRECGEAVRGYVHRNWQQYEVDLAEIGGPEQVPFWNRPMDLRLLGNMVSSAPVVLVWIFIITCVWSCFNTVGKVTDQYEKGHNYNGRDGGDASR
jgi:hypothetical protein